MLGQYQLILKTQDESGRDVAGGNGFRVEEYKKPEFEVTVEAPEEPVMLGEKIKAKIKAKYYFGSPVTEATVKYKITRTTYSQNWYPVMPWDWFYGKGYWWYAYDCPWYPGWSEWVGCRRPAPWWWHAPSAPPELVAEQEVPIGEDGTVEVEIDTTVAKELFGKEDHRYEITAEVRDQSRRTIVGQGQVLVAREPFRVYTWVNRGYFQTGDVAEVSFKALTLDSKPVQGKGVVTLYKITYDDKRQPIETDVFHREIETNDEGLARLALRMNLSGQYRVALKLTDAAEHTIEGAYLFTVIGSDMPSADFRFNSLELIPDKKEYAPGEKVQLQINVDKPEGTVLLFVRPANGVYLPPRVIRLTGKTTLAEIEVEKKDMPNFFVEAVTIADGRVYDESCEIVVPPEKRVLNVELEPSAEEYLPGQEATVKVRLTDLEGKPFVGTTVMTIYDKSVEYISGGSNVPEIREFFWKWRRRHQPRGDSSLQNYSGNMTLPNQPGMQFIGVFGATVATEEKQQSEEMLGLDMNGLSGGGFGGGGRQLQSRRGATMYAAKGMMADAAPGAPMALAAEAEAGEPADRESLRKSADDKPGSGPGEPTGPMVEPTVRSNFADTALWNGNLTTDKEGRAEVTLTMPENLTAWKIRLWAMGPGTKVGQADTEVVTRKNLILRMQTPRFMVQTDEVVLSANVHNYLDGEKQATVSLDVPEAILKILDEPTQTVVIPAGGEKRVDWRVKVLDEGQALIQMKALTDEESDAMQMTIPCQIHGMLKTESWAGTVRPDQEKQSVEFSVPAQRRIEQSRLEVRYSPTLAGAMVDALPYLAEYPYGCTEQTLNRFLPSVITQKVLLDMDLDLKAIQKKRTNLNAQEIGDDRERAEQWKRFDRNPVFDQEELDQMVKEGLKRLAEMQLSDGGWGWFSGYGEQSYPHTTAVVVHGLQVAQANGTAVVPDMLSRGIEWLARYQADELQKLRNYDAKKKDVPKKAHADNLDAMVFMILVDADRPNAAMQEYLYRDRNELSVYAKAMFALALEKLGSKDQLDMLAQNIGQYVVQDQENETAWLRMPEGNYWWCWYGSEVEANAYYLKLLSRIDPKGETAPRLVKYLLNNRKHSTYWNSTRDTALCVEAFSDYLRASGEMKPDMTVEIWVDGEKRGEARITPENLFTFDNKFVLEGEKVLDGKHTVEIRRTGQGPVYYNVYLTNFTLEDYITAAGLEVKVQRQFYKLVPVEKTIKVAGDRGQAVDQRVEKYERQPLADWAEVKSGDLIEVELSIESKNDYEYIIFEDMRAAGCEPVDVRSGYVRDGLPAYMEVRDNRTVFFVRALARGNHSIAYRLRAEIPGRFSALPTRAEAMYAPELRGNSNEMKLEIKD